MYMFTEWIFNGVCFQNWIQFLANVEEEKIFQKKELYVCCSGVIVLAEAC